MAKVLYLPLVVVTLLIVECMKKFLHSDQAAGHKPHVFNDPTKNDEVRYLDTQSVQRQFDQHNNEYKADPLNWKPPTVPDHLQDADQEDPELIRHIRENWIVPPFSYTRNISLSDTNKMHGDFSEQGQRTIINNVLNDRTNGFVIECGAADGILNSNSLYFELHRNWSGILIDANPEYFSSILEKRRHMYMLNACLSPTRSPTVFNFSSMSGIGGGIVDLVPTGQKELYGMGRQTHVLAQCFPLYSVLAALNIFHVDYFSLDVEGAELEVLSTIPYDKVTIDTFTIEKRVVSDEQETKQKERAIADMLESVGFRVLQYLSLDIVLVRT